MADKNPKGKKTSKIPGILAILGIIIVIIVAIIYFLPSASNFGQSTATTEKEPATSATKKPTSANSATQIPEEEGPFKGWGKFDNQTWGISARYPIGWTKNETASASSVIFAGPLMPGGGAIPYECTFSIFVEGVSSAIGLEAYVAAARTAPGGGGDITKQIETTLDGNTAIQIVDTYAEAGQPWRRFRTWTIKDRQAYTLTYAASPNYNKTDYYSPHEEDAELILESVLIK